MIYLDITGDIQPDSSISFDSSSDDDDVKSNVTSAISDFSQKTYNHSLTCQGQGQGPEKVYGKDGIQDPDVTKFIQEASKHACEILFYFFIVSLGTYLKVPMLAKAPKEPF